MNLADMLSYADIQQLKTIAKHYECECNGHSKNELIQSILMTVGRRDVMDRSLQQLSLEDLRFIHSLLFEKRNTYSLEELLARSSQTIFVKEQKENYNPRETITRFKQSGWLFNGYSPQTRYLFQVPNDLKQKMFESLTKKYESMLFTTTEPSQYRNEQSLLGEDILMFLKFVHLHDVPLTFEGTIYKRILQQLLDAMSVKEEPITKSGWRFGYGRRYRDYPDRFSFIYDYCYFNGLTTESSERLSITQLGTKRVLEGERESLKDLYRFWLRLYMSPIHNLVPIVHWVDKLSDSWVSVSSLKQALLDLIKPFNYDDETAVFERRIVKMMFHLGMIKLGVDEQIGQVITMTQLGRKVIKGIAVSEDEQIDIHFNTW